MKYGTIIYEVRDALDISNNEYLLLDCISKMQAGGDEPGWCKASANYLAWVVGIARRNMFPMYARLESRGLLEVRPTDGAKKASEIFLNAAIRGKIPQKLSDVTSPSDETSPVTLHHPPSDVTSLPPVTLHHPPSDVTSPNNTIILQLDNTIIKQGVPKKISATPPRPKNQNLKKSFGKADRQEGEPPLLKFSEWEELQGGAARQKFCADLLELVPGIDAAHYYDRVKTWSATKLSKSADWVQTAAGWARDDRQKNNQTKYANNGYRNTGNHGANGPTDTTTSRDSERESVARIAQGLIDRRTARNPWGNTGGG